MAVGRERCAFKHLSSLMRFPRGCPTGKLPWKEPEWEMKGSCTYSVLDPARLGPLLASSCSDHWDAWRLCRYGLKWSSVEAGLAGRETSWSADTAGISTLGWIWTLLQRRYCFKKNTFSVNHHTSYVILQSSQSCRDMTRRNEMAFECRLVLTPRWPSPLVYLSLWGSSTLKGILLA